MSKAEKQERTNPFWDPMARYGPAVVAQCEIKIGGFKQPVRIREDTQFKNVGTKDTPKYEKYDEKCIRLQIGDGDFRAKARFSKEGWDIFVKAVNLANKEISL